MWCRVPARSSASSRFLLVAVKNSVARRAFWVPMFRASMTTSDPSSAASSPFPVSTSTPSRRLSTAVSWPRSRAASVMRRPTMPVPPAIAILILTLSSLPVLPPTLPYPAPPVEGTEPPRAHFGVLCVTSDRQRR